MRGLSVFLAFMLMLVGARADERIGSFYIFDDYPTIIVLAGDIGINSPLEFRRALSQRPEAKVVVLSSEGGLVASGLLIADDIHGRGLSTIIPEDAKCYSACSFIFFAGHERQAIGELGVHQMWSEKPDPEGLQATVSDILEVLERFDTPMEVFTRMFRTPSDTMYVFTVAELGELGINRVSKVLGGKFDSGELSDLVVATNRSRQESTPTQTTQQPETSTPSLRLAIYEGLDFYGQDISSTRQKDVVACAASCLDNNQCMAFTFNANPSITSGPNCFLKSGTDRLEGYADALSGLFLGPQDGQAPTFRIGVIDPTQDVHSRTTLSGPNLNSVAIQGIDTPGECRMACVDEQACTAFSFSSSLRQCWLKSSPGQFIPDATMTSGTKLWMRFEAIEVLDLGE